MKLDLNCIRDTLFVLEENLILNDDLDFCTLDLHEICEFPYMKSYSLSEVAYTLIILEEAGFIKTTCGSNLIEYMDIVRLTYEGHRFLDTIRPTSTWDKIYSISEKTGLKSISTIMEIADILLPDTIKSAIQS